MWDLTHAERRALAGSLFLVGLAGIARTAFTPDATGAQWRDIAPSGGDAPMDSVAASLAREARVQTPLAKGEKIDVATAPVEELRRLPGVGPGLASRIVREREARPFAVVADLDRVAGIGPATMARLTEYVRVSGGRQVSPPVVGHGCRDGGVDLNHADPETLQRLPGIGPALAKRIVAYRTREGPYEDVDALTAVRGIGPSALARLGEAVCAR